MNNKIYTDNNVMLFNYDCIEVMDSLISEGVKVDLIVTDPPYDMDKSRKKPSNDLSNMINKNILELEELGITNSIDYEEVLDRFEKLQDKTNIYIFCNKKQIPFYLDYYVLKRGCSFDILKWVKTNSVPNYNNKYMTDTEYILYVRKGGYCNPTSYEDGSTLFHQPINKKDKELYEHPTIKPLNILNRLIRNSSKENEVVLDVFYGSGSTGVSCMELGRKFIGCELSEKYFNIGKERILNSFNQSISKVNNKNYTNDIEDKLVS